MSKTRIESSPPLLHGHGNQHLASAAGTPLNSARPDAFVVDDEVGICQFVSLRLEALGLAAESFHTAQDAVAALERGHPEIVFLDVALGRSDAVDVIRSLGERGYTGAVQLMSGHKSSLLDDVHRIGVFHGLNMCPPLEKPFRAEAIGRAVANLPLYDRPAVSVSFAPALQPGLDMALTNGWLELWYQPKIDLRTNALAGAEGLIRYRHPIHGIHTIDGILPAASAETRAALTEHFVITALRDWSELDRVGIHVPIALNASFDALANVDLATLVRQNWPKSKNWPGLVLEVGEHEVIRDLNLAHEIATQLRIYDIKLAINNFGAGFSSLERLCELPFSELKLHASFVGGCAMDPRNAGICRAAIELAHRFELIAVADGVENASDLSALQSMGCDVGQGPLFGEPMPRAQLEAALHDRARIGQAWIA
jgi:EAL domain-containing protein (putative c-di-GMP-specific phosphodiesterase class I)/CheY-like chemotaxis protein